MWTRDQNTSWLPRRKPHTSRESVSSLCAQQGARSADNAGKAQKQTPDQGDVAIDDRIEFAASISKKADVRNAEPKKVFKNSVMNGGGA